jgi:hypothetical protein
MKAEKRTIYGNEFRCVICKGEEFSVGHFLLNTRFNTLINSDWMDKGATCLICNDCSYIHWFAENSDTLLAKCDLP